MSAQGLLRAVDDFDDLVHGARSWPFSHRIALKAADFASRVTTMRLEAEEILKDEVHRSDQPITEALSQLARLSEGSTDGRKVTVERDDIYGPLDQIRAHVLEAAARLKQQG